MKTRFKVQKRVTYKIFDIQKNEFWQICFNDWNSEDINVARNHCDHMNILFQKAVQDDYQYQKYLAKKHK